MLLLFVAPTVSKIKHKKTKVIPNLIVCIAPLESICLLLLVFQSNTFGITPTFYLSVVALVFLFTGNVFFHLIYVNQI